MSKEGRVLSLPTYQYRDALYEELHTRPSPKIQSPCYVSYFSLTRSENEIKNEFERVVNLCRRFSVNPPSKDVSCFHQDMGGFEFRWERHSEFSTYSFIRPDDGLESPDFALAFVPKDWLETLLGEVVVALHMKVNQEHCDDGYVSHFFEGQRQVGSRVANGKARVLTSFRLHSDGFSRYLLNNMGLNQYQMGRLVQRLLELETYRVMTLMGLPVARGLSSEVAAMESKVVELNQQIADIGSEDDERQLLTELSLIAARIEQCRSDSNYRFSASNAYHALVARRLEQVFEQHISGVQTMREFLERRLTPSIRTCNSVRDRLEDLSRRIHRTTSLLRTRVEVSIESQNHRLLGSMDRRAGLQLRLQQTVEGLSVVAIAYYLLSLLGYFFAGLESWGYPIDKTVATGIAMPVVVSLVYWSVRGHIKKLEKNTK